MPVLTSVEKAARSVFHNLSVTNGQMQIETKCHQAAELASNELNSSFIIISSSYRWTAV